MTTMESTARELLAELERAHTIILHVLPVMTPEQKQEWTAKNDSAGLVEGGTTRFHERRKVMASARGALADASAEARNCGVGMATPAGYALVPLDPPESLRGQLCGYGADLSYMDSRDRAVILQRGAERWAEILRWAGAGGVGGKTE